MMGTDFDFSSAILRARESYEARAGSRGLLERRHWRVKPPSWARKMKDSRFEEQYRHQTDFSERGKIVWAATVQANNELFVSAKDDHPAMLLYGTDSFFDGRPHVLLQAANLLFEIKGRRCEADLQPIADRIADEVTVEYKLEVPRRLTEGRPCYLTTIMIHRAHLPAKRLRGPLMPLLTCPTDTEATMVLPARYWDRSFVRECWAEY